MWDVQHGSAAYIRTPNGKHIVIDLGTGDISGDTSTNGVFSPLLHIKEVYNISQIDQVIITHPHRDHVDDIENFDLLKPKVLLRPKHIPSEDIRKQNQPKDTSIIEKYLEIDNRYNSPITTGENPKLAENNGGVEISTFTPTTCATSNLNNQSIVTFLSYAGSTICIPGDNEKASWRELLKNQKFRDLIARTNILVASHHGRESGYCDDIFDLCKAPTLKLVIISDGPQGETCAADSYRRKVQGWKVHSLSVKSSEDRRVLTTRRDGAIQIECYTDGGNNYLIVNKE